MISFVSLPSVITVKLSVSDKAPLPAINLLINCGVTFISSSNSGIDLSWGGLLITETQPVTQRIHDYCSVPSEFVMNVVCITESKFRRAKRVGHLNDIKRYYAVL